MHQRDARQLSCSIQSDLLLLCRNLNRSFIYYLHLWNCRLQMWSPKAGLPGVCCWNWQTHVPMYIPVLKPGHAFDTVALAVEYVRKELWVWLWYFLIGPTIHLLLYMHMQTAWMHIHVYDIVWSIHLYFTFPSFDLYVCIRVCICMYKLNAELFIISHEMLDCFTFRLTDHKDM